MWRIRLCGEGRRGRIFHEHTIGGYLQNHIFQAVTNIFDVRSLNLFTKNT